MLRILAFVTLIACLPAAGRAGPLPEPDDCKPDPNDWPMLAHDALHTGCTAIGVERPYKTLWRWFDGRPWPMDQQPPARNRVVFFSNCQPVVADGLLYIGAMNGRLYALKADSGEVAWTQQTGRQITHTACVYGPHVVVNCTDGKVYAFDRKTGRPGWTVATGAPLYSAPVARGGRIYVAGRDRRVYAIHYNTGRVLWRAKVGDQCMTSPACDGEAVYVGTESGVAWAFAARDGSRLWRTALPASSMRHVWPVVAREAGVVIYRTMPLHGSSRLFGAIEQMLRAEPDLPWRELQKKIRRFFTDHPDHQTFFALECRTGRQRFVAPVAAIMRHQDTPTPPVIGPGGVCYVNYRTNRSGSFKGMSFGTSFSLDIGILDLKTGDVRTFAPKGTFSTFSIESGLDDSSAYALAGNWLVGSHTCHPGGRIGQINVKDHRQFGGVSDRWNYDRRPFPGGWGGHDRIYRKNQRVPLTDRGWNANIGMGYSSPVVVRGVVYSTHVSGSALVAIEGKAVRK